MPSSSSSTSSRLVVNCVRVILCCVGRGFISSCLFFSPSCSEWVGGWLERVGLVWMRCCLLSLEAVYGEEEEERRRKARLLLYMLSMSLDVILCVRVLFDWL